MFLGKYKNIRTLGKGSFGVVHLVEDQESRQLYALKILDLKLINDPEYKYYLQGEITCMQKIDSPYFIKLYGTFEDQDFFYLLLQYCEAGTINQYQNNLPHKVFTLQHATVVLSDVVRGLQSLHRQGFVHRDIKPENILVKAVNGKEMFKLADFGFSKPLVNTRGTNLGTDDYKAPEVYNQEIYGFGVDMWSFAILFYQMLNCELPFKFGKFQSQASKQKILSELGENFSFQKFVKASKNRRIQNCRPQTEDLFTKMLQLDPLKRINFAEIRQHPVFKKHFPEHSQDIKLFYSKKFVESLLDLVKMKKKSLSREKEPKTKEIKSSKQLLQEIKQLKQRKVDINFLSENCAIFLLDCDSVLQQNERAILAFYILKYSIKLLRQLIGSLSIENVESIYQTQTQEWKIISELRQVIVHINNDVKVFSERLKTLCNKCQGRVDEFTSLNQDIVKKFFQEMSQPEYRETFKQNYYLSIDQIYKNLKQKVKTVAGTHIYYILVLIAMSFSFKKIFGYRSNLGRILEPFLKEKRIEIKDINYTDLRVWLANSSKLVLAQIVKNIADLN